MSFCESVFCCDPTRSLRVLSTIWHLLPPVYRKHFLGASGKFHPIDKTCCAKKIQIHADLLKHYKWFHISWLFWSLAVNKPWPQLGFGLLVTWVAESFCHWCYVASLLYLDLTSMNVSQIIRDEQSTNCNLEPCLRRRLGWTRWSPVLLSSWSYFKILCESFLVILFWLFVLSRLLLFPGLLVVVWGSKAILGYWALTISSVDQHLFINHYRYLLCPITNTTRGLVCLS